MLECFPFTGNPGGTVADMDSLRTAFEPLSSLKPCNTTSLSYYDLSTRDTRYLHFSGTVTSYSDSSIPGCKGRFVRREDLNGLQVSGVTAVPMRWFIGRKGITVTRIPNQLERLWNISLGQGLCCKMKVRLFNLGMCKSKDAKPEPPIAMENVEGKHAVWRLYRGWRLQ